MVTNAHRVKVEEGADGHASASPSGAAAAAPPAGATVHVLLSVRRLLCIPMFPLPVCLHRVAAPRVVLLRDALSATLLLPPLLCA
jgi:hypothetical protein